MFGYSRETPVATLSTLIIAPCERNPETSLVARIRKESAMFRKFFCSFWVHHLENDH